MTERYYELAAKVRENLDECGIALDLNHPADRAILDECGLTREEAFEFLSLFDERQVSDDVQDDTRRVVVGKW